MKIKDIEFVDTDTKKTKSNVIAVYESLTDRTLARGDPVRLFLESIAAIITQQKAIINFTGKMNLLAYAESDYLDHLGILVGTKRIPACAAQVTAEITLSAIQQSAIIIPKGTRITARDGIFFATVQQTIIAAGKLKKEIIATCTQPGSIGNGYLAGQLKTIVDPIPYVQTIQNITESAGGADSEDDNNYRNRIHEAPESFSCAGPEGAYLYYTKSTSSLIADVAVISPIPGKVEIIPLLNEGQIPSEEIIAEVLAVCNDKKVRPLTDQVTVLAPSAVSFAVKAKYYIDSADALNAVAIQTAVEAAVNSYILWQKAKLGRDINPSELITRMVNAGAKRANIELPAFTAVTKKQVAIADDINIAFGGVDDD